MRLDAWDLEYYYRIFIMRQKTYGEVAFETYCKLIKTGATPLLKWDNLSDEMHTCWENTAAAVLAEYHKRQIELSRQTPSVGISAGATIENLTDVKKSESNT